MPVNKESMYPGMADAPATTETQLCFMPPNGPFDGKSSASMVTGMLNDRDDVEDWILIKLSEGKEYTISLKGSTTLTDTVIALYDSKGGVVEAPVDDVDRNRDGKISGAELHPTLTFRPEEGSGTSDYFISVSAYRDNPGTIGSDGTNKGGYTVTVNEKSILAVGDGRGFTDNSPKLVGTDLDDKLTGGDGDQTLYGRAGDDVLDGKGGNDLLIGGKGADTLKGGDGEKDTISYRDSAMAVTINLLSGQADGGDATGDTLDDSIEYVIGSMHDDRLTGNDEDNWLWGLAGMDTLDGGFGEDTLEGGHGGDTLIGGDGGDTASYAGSMMGVTVRLHSQQAMGGDAEGDVFGRLVRATYPNDDGDIVVEMVPDIERLTGSAHDDILAGDSRANIIMGGDGHDRLYGGPGGGDDVLHGDKGNDRIFGGKGDDMLHGGDGNDHLWGNSGTDIYDGGKGNDTIYASKDDTNIDGGEGNDTLSYARLEDTPGPITLSGGISGIENIIGSQDDDTITGDAGKNVIEGGEGGDTMISGGTTADGKDTLSYASSDAGVRVTLRDTADTGNNGNWINASRGHASGDRVTAGGRDAQRFFDIKGSTHDDDLTGDNRGNNLMGGDGDDELTGMAGADIIEGGAGSDMLDGGDESNVFGTGGNSTPDLGDWLSYASSDAGVTINLARQLATGGHASGDTIVTAEEDHDGNDETDEIDVSTFEHIRGSAHSDDLTGDHRSNTLEGGGGADDLDGGTGMDTATFANARAGVTVDLGANRGMKGDAEGDTYSNIEMFVGSGKADTFIAGRGHDTVDGGAGSDTISYDKSRAGVTVNLATQVSPANGDAPDPVGAWRYLVNNLGKFYVDGDGDSVKDNRERGFDSLADLLGGLDPSNTGNGIDPGNIKVDDGGMMDDRDPPQPVDDVTLNSVIADTSDGQYGTTVSVITGLYGNDNTRADLRNDFNKGDRLDNIENVIGSDFNDNITGNSAAIADNPDTPADDESMVRGSGNKLEGGAGKDTITGGAGNDVIDGGEGDDPMLDGGAGHDDIKGGAGRDTLVGGASDQDHMDTLDGGAGDDELTGGGGSDTFVFAPGHGEDLITDFAAGDKIDLKAFGIKDLQDLKDDIREFGGNVRIDLSDYEGGGTIIFQTSDVAGTLGLIGTANGDNTGVTNITADDTATQNMVEGIFII
ncbi:MAG: calcium-binding protein [Gammaproteobacteria bacterium]|nr:calcium-binding protein [Gammaproteobacteria bacterium]